MTLTMPVQHKQKLHLGKFYDMRPNVLDWKVVLREKRNNHWPDERSKE